MRRLLLLAVAGLVVSAPAEAGPKLVVRPIVIGHSVEGRPLIAVELGNPARPKTVVVGCIHGNEPGGLAIVHLLERTRLPSSVDLWLVENMNPDGFSDHTRQNARGVDLNRNFAWHWRRLGPRGSYEYSGAAPFSEPESRAVRQLLLRLKPRIVIWYHQPLGTVDESGGPAAAEERYADLVRLPFRRLARYPGSATSWADHTFPGASSFVVELPPGPLSASAARRHASAVVALARSAR